MRTGASTSAATAATESADSHASVAVGFGREYFLACGEGYLKRLAAHGDSKHDNKDKEEGEVEADKNVNTDEVDSSDTNTNASPLHSPLHTDGKSERIACQYWESPPWAQTRGSGSNNDYHDGESDIAQIECSSQSTVFLTTSGRVYQVGTMHGKVARTPVPVTIKLPRKCVQIAAGRHFCLGRMEGGLAVVSWGVGHFGQLGMSSSSNNSGEGNVPLMMAAEPVVIDRLLPRATGSPIKSVAAGDWHALALTESGRVWAWGCNRSYQCGRKLSNGSNSNDTASNINSGGSQASTILVPLPVPIEYHVVQISAGRSHSLALVNVNSSTNSSNEVRNCQVYAWGSALHGQCGNAARRTGVAPPRPVDGLNNLNIVQIAAGGNHSIALTGGGRVFSWGSSTQGQLGLGIITGGQSRPRQIVDLDFLAVKAGQEWHLQQRKDGKYKNDVTAISKKTVEEHLSDTPRITFVGAGDACSIAISSSGHLYAWGSNDAGQLGFSIPSNLPFMDNSLHIPSASSSNRDSDVRTFDSDHDMLLPCRNDALSDLYVTKVSCGHNHMWVLGKPRITSNDQVSVGKTLYEVQEVKKAQSHQMMNDVTKTKPMSDSIAGDNNRIDGDTVSTEQQQQQQQQQKQQERPIEQSNDGVTNSVANNHDSYSTQATTNTENDTVRNKFDISATSTQYQDDGVHSVAHIATEMDSILTVSDDQSDSVDHLPLSPPSSTKRRSAVIRLSSKLMQRLGGRSGEARAAAIANSPADSTGRLSNDGALPPPRKLSWRKSP